MSGLLLVAASGLAREVLALLEAVAEDGARYREVALVDDDPQLWGTQVHGRPVLGGLDLVAERADDEVVVCVGRGPTRRAVVQRLTTSGVEAERFTTLVHPDVRIPSSCRVGRGSLLLAGSVLTADVRVGEHVVVMPHVTLTHDDVVEDHATLCAGVTLAGGVHVGGGAYLGAASHVREGIRIGEDTVLGMGSVLLVDLPATETWAGVPARRLGPYEGVT